MQTSWIATPPERLAMTICSCARILDLAQTIVLFKLGLTFNSIHVSGTAYQKDATP